MATVVPVMTDTVTTCNTWIERRIVCRHCSGAKHTFKHDPDGLRLFILHLDLVHRVTITQAEKNEITNA